MPLECATSIAIDTQDLEKPLVVSYDTSLGAHPNAAIFKKTLDNHNWQHALIRLSEKYKSHVDKLNGYAQFLQGLPSDKIVILSDSWDVLCCRNSRAFMTAYKSLQSDFVVSMELFCHTTLDDVTTPMPLCTPLTKYWAHYGQIEWPLRKYVNSGLVCGKAGAILEWLQFSLEGKYEDDQTPLGVYMNTYPDRVYADIDRVLLHSSTFGKNGGQYDMNRQKHDAPTFAEIFGRDSFFLHFPGLCFEGQEFLYNFTVSLIKSGYDSSVMNALYKSYDFDYNELLLDHLEKS